MCCCWPSVALPIERCRPNQIETESKGILPDFTRSRCGLRRLAITTPLSFVGIVVDKGPEEHAKGEAQSQYDTRLGERYGADRVDERSMADSMLLHRDLQPWIRADVD